VAALTNLADRAPVVGPGRSGTVVSIARGGPDYLPTLRRELLEMIRRYVNVDPSAVQLISVPEKLARLRPVLTRTQKALNFYKLVQ
jgi:hypothetical protein